MNIVEFRIGRNYATGEEMSDTMWSCFVDWCCDFLESMADTMNCDWVEVHKGIGAWDGESEESAVVTLYHEFTLDEAEEAHITSFASHMAMAYGQQAIGVVFGRSVLARSCCDSDKS